MHGFRLEGLHGLMVYLDVPGQGRMCVEPLRAFLTTLVEPSDIIAVNTPELSALAYRTIESASLTTSAVGYRGSFFQGDPRQSFVLEAGRLDLLLGELGAINRKDSWCVYTPGDEGRADLVRLLELTTSGVPESPSFGEIWVKKVMARCPFVLAPGADGAILEVWSRPEDRPPDLDRALAAANEVLRTIVAQHGELPYDEMLNTYAQPRRNG